MSLPPIAGKAACKAFEYASLAVCRAAALAWSRASSASTNWMEASCDLASSDNDSSSYGLLSIVIVVMENYVMKKPHPFLRDGVDDLFAYCTYQRQGQKTKIKPGPRSRDPSQPDL